MNSLVSSVPDQRSPQAISAPTRSKPGRVSGKLAAAIERMVELGEPFDVAGRNVGLTARAMRLALDKPHVMKHLRMRKQVFRESVSAANIHRLAAIRDKAENMPAVNAIAMLERLSDDQQQAQRSSAPGFQIAIVVQDNRANAVESQDTSLIIQGKSLPMSGRSQLQTEPDSDE